MVQETPLPTGLMPQISAAQTVQALLAGAQIPCCIIGGMALARWGEPRMTVDVDITVLAPFGEEPSVVDFLLAHLDARILNAREFAIQNRVLLLRSGGIDIDISLGALPFEIDAISRSSSFKYAVNVWLTTCSAEDLVVFKAFASRPRDWVDLEGLILRQSESLNWQQIDDDLAPLAALKDAPEILERLAALRTTARHR